MLDEIIKSMVSRVYFFTREQLVAHWPYVVGFFIFVIAGVILQIIMLRSGGHSKLPAFFNRLVGSLIYSIFFLIQLSISYWIFGTRVVDEIWFTLFGIISFPITGFFLRAIGFWYY
jgi:hypothetical protein